MKASTSRWLIALMALLAAAAAQATSSIYTVTGTGSGGTCTANSTSDANCTLDAAITAAASSAIVEFAPSVQGQTIAVTLGLPLLTRDITIDASPNGVTLDGGGTANVFYVDSGAHVVLRRLTVRHGLGSNSGGGLYNNSGSVTIDSCTFADNSATQAGGAVANLSTLLVFNSTFANNHSDFTSGAIYSGYLDTLVIANSTFAGNTASNNGGAVLNVGTGTLLSNIFAGNTAPTGPNINNAGTLTSLGHNLISNTAGSGFAAQTGDQVGVDPLFASALLADNGGPTQTIALQPGSPARSGGDCSGNASNPTIPSVPVDQRGFARSTPCTIGAFDMTSIFYGTFEAQ